jgi:hypothetical protein
LLTHAWASIKRTSKAPETSIESVLRLKSSLLPFRCLVLILFVSLNSVQNTVYRIIEVVFPSNFLPVKMTVSCLATDGRHLGSGLVTKQSRKKWAQNIILPAAMAMPRPFQLSFSLRGRPSVLWGACPVPAKILPVANQAPIKLQHELHLWIYYYSKFLNTSEFIIMINSRQILNLS